MILANGSFMPDIGEKRTKRGASGPTWRMRSTSALAVSIFETIGLSPSSSAFGQCHAPDEIQGPSAAHRHHDNAV
jgi:hypothetical protein